MVRLFYSINGRRGEWTVPFHEARKINRQIFLQGGVVYWTEGC